MHCVRKPAGIMDKSNVDWLPTMELGHNKTDTAALQAASES